MAGRAENNVNTGDIRFETLQDKNNPLTETIDAIVAGLAQDGMLALIIIFGRF